jgi:hypothetical protein
MPTYDYVCPANGQVVEVQHRMHEQLRTWGELCERKGMECGATPPDSPVHKLANGGQIVKRSHLGSGTEPACNAGACCGGGLCGLE